MAKALVVCLVAFLVILLAFALISLTIDHSPPCLEYERQTITVPAHIEMVPTGKGAFARPVPGRSYEKDVCVKYASE